MARSRKPSLAGFTWGAASARPATRSATGRVDLVGAAEARAVELGHELSAWRAEGGRRVAACARCGAEVTVERMVLRPAIVAALRANGAIVGDTTGEGVAFAAGAALEACSP